MSEIRDDLVYSKEHEWAGLAEGNRVRVGITDHAQDLLGDIVFVEYPQVGDIVEADASIGTIESVKTVSELYSPVSGTIVSVNGELQNRPELLNAEPYEGGWIVEIELSEPAEEAFAKLLTPDQYRAHIE
ncbi:glycine cleavage system H protein [Paenibacillus phyllosphaerae]|uniref:Glycine cleavage system H protein n=1 Tax=Paenibacillus phyllosphaerae TaxID=274593 RepID=A0A7W5FPM5_9BACL|nr:glycine cleavage system protein GcvH [Paenibacillus phyllosphaerae]MBB3112526.1 glycine cleavage system H protein [Paenibacillus phyllosphaerae]